MMIETTYEIVQNGKSLIGNKIVINKYENKTTKLHFTLDETIEESRVYFALLNPILNSYKLYPLSVNNEIVLSTEMSRYPGIWRSILIATDEEYDIDADLDQTKCTYVSNEAKFILVRDNFLSDETIEYDDNPAYQKTLDEMLSMRDTLEKWALSANEDYNKATKEADRAADNAAMASQASADTDIFMKETAKMKKEIENLVDTQGDYCDIARGWAVGMENVPETVGNNAKYYAEQAKKSQEEISKIQLPKDGVSPTVSTKETDKGVEITITDGSGDHTVELLKGKDGLPGEDGYTPVKGVDYFDGEKGDKGDPGESYDDTEIKNEVSRLKEDIVDSNKFLVDGKFSFRPDVNQGNITGDDWHDDENKCRVKTKGYYNTEDFDSIVIDASVYKFFTTIFYFDDSHNPIREAKISGFNKIYKINKSYPYFRFTVSDTTGDKWDNPLSPNVVRQYYTLQNNDNIYTKLFNKIMAIKGFKLYISNNKGITYKYNTSDGSVVVTFNSYINIQRIGVGNNVGISVKDAISTLGSNYAKSEGNEVLVVTIPMYKILCLDINTIELLIKDTTEVTIDDVILISNGYANISSGILADKMLEKEIDVLSDNLQKASTDIRENTEKINNTIPNSIYDSSVQYESILKNNVGDILGKNITDSFLFFTDPHVLGNANNFKGNIVELFLKKIGRIYNSSISKFAICCGDALNNGDNNINASYKLSFYKKMCDRYINKCYQVVGNHDTNSHGEGAGDAVPSPNKLSIKDIENVLFLGDRHYYCFDTDFTKYYVLDTGDDWDVSMASYERWEQVDWLGKKLIEDDREHSAIIMHMVYDWESTTNLHPITKYIRSMINAYNNKTNITVNGINYDFIHCTGNVEFVLGGHHHKDICNYFENVPYICSINTDDSDNPNLDLVTVDYDNNQIIFRRIGIGEDRTFNIYSGSK